MQNKWLFNEVVIKGNGTMQIWLALARPDLNSSDAGYENSCSSEL